VSDDEPPDRARKLDSGVRASFLEAVVKLDYLSRASIDFGCSVWKLSEREDVASVALKLNPKKSPYGPKFYCEVSLRIPISSEEEFRKYIISTGLAAPKIVKRDNGFYCFNNDGISVRFVPLKN
jgi:hypothetical protein